MLLGLDWLFLYNPHFNFRKRTFVWPEVHPIDDGARRRDSGNENKHASMKIDIWTADDNRTQLAAVLDSGARFCMMKLSRARALGLEILPCYKRIENVSGVEMKPEGQVLFSFWVHDSCGVEDPVKTTHFSAL